MNNALIAMVLMSLSAIIIGMYAVLTDKKLKKKYKH